MSFVHFICDKNIAHACHKAQVHVKLHCVCEGHTERHDKNGDDVAGNHVD